MWADSDGIHARRVDVQVGTGARIVPDRQRAMRTQEVDHRIRIGDDAGHVRRRRESADLQISLAVFMQRPGQRLQVGTAFGGLGISTTSARLSRQGRMFEWCSYGPMKTTGRSARFTPRRCTNLFSPRWHRSR